MCKEATHRQFVAHEIFTTFSLGWQSLVNGQLLRKADREGFDVLITVDKNMPYQSSLKGLNLCVVVLDTPSNSLQDLIIFAKRFLEQVDRVTPGEFWWIRDEKVDRF